VIDGEKIGEESADGEGQKVEEIQGERVQSVSPLRATKGILPKIQYVPNMYEKIRLEGGNSRSG
jgi:hypothetical protein